MDLYAPKKKRFSNIPAEVFSFLSKTANIFDFFVIFF